MTTISKISIINGAIRGLNMMMTFFFAIYFIQIGLSGTQIGLLFAINNITSLITILPSGLSNDKLHSKNLINIGLILTAIMYIGLGITKNPAWITIVFLLGGIGRNIFSTSIESLFYKTSDQNTISKQIGALHSLLYLTMGFGIILAGYLLSQNIDFEKIFLAMGVVHLLFIVVSQISLPTNPTTEFEILHYKKDLWRKEILFLLLIIFLFALHIGAELVSYGPFLKNYLKLGSLGIGLYMGTAILFMAITSKVISQNLAKFQAKNVLKFGLLFSGLFHMLMAINITPLSFTARVLHETGDAAIFFFLTFGVAKLFSIERIGGNNSVIIFVTALGAAASSIIFGPIAANYGYQIPIIISGGTTLLAFLLTIPFTRLIDHK